jgi:hypothetical protein
MSDIFTAQITAVANVVLAVFAIITAVFAGLAFRKQSQEVGLLLEQSKRDESERRRAQAARVYVMAEPDPPRLIRPYARNASDFPIYDAQIWQAKADGISAPAELGTVMPGKSATGGAMMSARDAAAHSVLTFRDSQGVRWIRMPDGTLSEQTGPSPRDAIAALR